MCVYVEDFEIGNCNYKKIKKITSTLKPPKPFDTNSKKQNTKLILKHISNFPLQLMISEHIVHMHKYSFHKSGNINDAL